MGGPRVAVVGAGAWGTTLARVVARGEPVILWCHSPETAARIAATGRNEARLPGVDLPRTVVATADPASPRRRDRPRDLRDAIGPPANDRGAAGPVPRAVGRHRVGRQGPRARQPAPDERGHRRGGGHPGRSDRRAVGPEPGRRDRPGAAGVGRRRGHGPGARRARRGPPVPPALPALRQPRHPRRRAGRARSRTSSRSRRAPRTAWASATTARRACSRAVSPR